MFPIRDHHPSHKFPFVTVGLIILNVLVFLYQLALPDVESFIYTFALVPQFIDFASPETLIPFITSMFMHGGFLHIISNMWFLWIFGDNVEATLGHLGFIGFYLISGIGASLLQYVINPDSVIPMLGASGAIAGVLGGYLVLFPHAQIETILTLGYFFNRINVSAKVMLIYWFVIQFFSGIGSLAIQVGDRGGVAFFAHIGGFVVGWVITQFFVKPTIKWQRIE